MTGLRATIGQAGTGKTTRLLSRLDEELAKTPLRDGQRALALTFMHGSRLRLTERLQRSSAQGRFDCWTFDRFARELCARWSTRLAQMGIALPDDDSSEVHDVTCAASVSLLESGGVAEWVALQYPVILVDEFQDCFGARPSIVECLSSRATVFVAADPFQDLSGKTDSPALKLLNATAGIEELTTQHRTHVPGLLAAAAALRAGRPLAIGEGFDFKGVPAAPLAAFEVCKFMAKRGAEPPVVLTPSRPKPNGFVAKVLDGVRNTKGYGPKKNLGPYSLPWETTSDDLREEVDDAIALGTSDVAAAAISSRLPTGNPLSRLVNEWLDRERTVLGVVSFSPDEVRRQLGRAEARYRSLPHRLSGRRVMTIHQAKNREFSRVIVLWPFEIGGDAERHSRLLYNAVTRARDSACVIVQDPRRTRVNEAPFK